MRVGVWIDGELCMYVGGLESASKHICSDKAKYFQPPQ